MTHDIFDIKEAHTCQTGHFTAEGPIWDPTRKVIFYTDIEGGTLHRYNPVNDQTTTWQIGEKGAGDKNGQMIGGTTVLNSDGSLILLLEKGPNAGVNYFNPDTNILRHIPDTQAATELSKPCNRANDSTVIDTGKEKFMVYGTMSKKWERHKQPDGSIPASGFEGDFYVLDANFLSHKLKFEGHTFPGVAITNGLASRGLNSDGTVDLYWAETVGANSALNVYKGNLDLETYTVKNVEVFADHQALTDGREGRPDGANMVNFKGKPAYAVAALQTGEIRLFDPESKSLLASIRLPKEISNVTKFAIGEKDGKPVAFLTTINFGYPKDKETSPNGSTFLIDLPKEISLHPASVRTTDYFGMEEMKQRNEGRETYIPPSVATLAGAKVVEPTRAQEKTA